MMDTWRELLGGVLAAWGGVVEAALTFRLTPAVENALIAGAVVCGVGMFVAAGLAARQSGRR